MTGMTDPNGWRDDLTQAEAAALATLPLPRAGEPARLIAERGYGDLWRKASKHRRAMEALEQRGIVEQRESRGETLWRPTKPYGLMVRAALPAPPAQEGR